MRLLLLIWAWVATISMVLLAMRVIHLLAVQRKINWIIKRQSDTVAMTRMHLDEQLEIVADQGARMKAAEKLALSWQSEYTRLVHDVKTSYPTYSPPFVNLTTEKASI